jgi:putative addiction module component (TIGR02574 family)
MVVPFEAPRASRRRDRIRSVTREDLINAALALDPKSRAQLTHRLIESLDEPGERLSAAEWEAAWEAEAERRLAEMREGKLQGAPSEQVFARGRARINS